ncbi:MAG: YbaK/EbsC family protein [Patescibacteria group bacterium]
MKIPTKITNFLDKNKIKYQVLEHRTVFTAYDLAQTLKQKLGEVIKTLVVKVDQAHALVILPASHQVDFKALKKAIGAKLVAIDKEQIMTKLFKVKPGAVSSLYGPLNKLPVYADKTVLKLQKAIVQAGSFENSLHIKTKDLLKVLEAKVVKFAVAKKLPKVSKGKK